MLMAALAMLPSARNSPDLEVLSLNFLHTSQKRVGSNRPAQGRALPWVLYELS
jgi:hypothetical protein